MKESKILKTFIWLHIVFVGAQAYDLIAGNNDAALNVTSSLEDYIDQLQRQYSYVISNDEALLVEFRDDFERQLAAIEAYRNFVETELVVADKKLYTLQFLNEISKYCVQKYRGLLYVVTKLQSNYYNCIYSARTSVTGILQYAQSNLNSLKTLINTTFKNMIADCERKNKASYTNQTLCVVNANNIVSISFQTTQRTFQTNLDSARCTANTRIQGTVECTFKYINESLSSIDVTRNAVDRCITGLETCKPCQDQNGNGNNNDTSVIVPQPQCPNVINVFTGAELYRNETIRNPFVGLNSTLDCILVNFVQPS